MQIRRSATPPFYFQHMDKIQISAIDHFIHESEMWERALNFFKQENAFLKTRLSQVVDNNTDKDFVELAEHFQNRFLFTDEYIRELCRDIRLQLDQVKKVISPGTLHNNGSMQRVQDKLRNEMEKFERNFSLLRNEFNQKLVSFILRPS